VTDTNADAGITLRDGPNLDAFARLRVSQPANLFDSKLTYNLAPLSWQTVTAGSGAAAHLPAEAACRMRVTGGTASVAGSLTWTEVR